MLVQRLEQYQKETRQRKRLDETRRKVEVLKYKLKERRDQMQYMKPKPKKKMTAKQKTLPKSLQKKIIASKGKKK